MANKQINHKKEVKKQSYAALTGLKGKALKKAKAKLRNKKQKTGKIRGQWVQGTVANKRLPRNKRMRNE